MGEERERSFLYCSGISGDIAVCREIICTIRKAKLHVLEDEGISKQIFIAQANAIYSHNSIYFSHYNGPVC